MSEGNKLDKIFWIGGSKGGVGKSMMTLATLDYLLDQNSRVVLVECDTSNPDVFKAYGQHPEVHPELLDLDGADGWIQLVNVCEEHRGAPIVINSAARNNVAVRLHGGTLEGSLEDLGRRWVVLWMINRQRDSLELLSEFMDAAPRAEVHAVRNAHFGREGTFDLFNTSKVRTEVEERGGKSVTFPELATRVADDIYSKRLTLSEAAKELPIGNRAELRRWQGEVRKILSEVIV